jgi:hypothetical protein
VRFLHQTFAHTDLFQDFLNEVSGLQLHRTVLQWEKVVQAPHLEMIASGSARTQGHRLVLQRRPLQLAFQIQMHLIHMVLQHMMAMVLLVYQNNSLLIFRIRNVCL